MSVPCWPEVRCREDSSSMASQVGSAWGASGEINHAGELMVLGIQLRVRAEHVPRG